MREQNNEIFFFIFLIFSFKFNFNFVNFFLCSPFFIWKFLKYFSVNFLLRILKHLLFFSTEFLVPFFMYIAWRTKEDKKKFIAFLSGWFFVGAEIYLGEAYWHAFVLQNDFGSKISNWIKFGKVWPTFECPLRL